MGKGKTKYFFIILGIGIGFVISGIYYLLNPQIEYKLKQYTKQEILEMAAEIKLEEAKKNKIETENTGENEEEQQKDVKVEDTGEKDVQTDDSNVEDEENKDEPISENEENKDEPISENEESDTNEDGKVDQQQENQQGNEEELDKENDAEKDGDKENIEEEYVSVRIEWGEPSEIIANRLFEKGVIQDKSAFNRYLREKKFEKKLVSGTYKLTKNMDFSTLIDKLTQ